MNPDVVLPTVASLGWLFFCLAALASYRLKWRQIVKLALVWVAIFLGLYLILAWFMAVRDNTGTLV